MFGKRHLIIYILVGLLLSLVVCVLIWGNSEDQRLVTNQPTIENNKQYAFKVGGETVKVGGQLKPSAELERFGGQVSMTVRYAEEGDLYKVIQKDDKVIWTNNQREVHFYPIKKAENKNIDKQSFMDRMEVLVSGLYSSLREHAELPERVEAEVGSGVRLIDLDKVDLEEMPAIYDLFKETSRPTVVTYVPKQNAFGFYGYRELDQDLKKEKLSLPVVRYHTGIKHSCPVTYLLKDSLMFMHLYDSRVSEDPQKYFSMFEDAIGEVLDKYGIELVRADHSLFYRDGLALKQIGRISDDGDIMNYYIYLDSPLLTEFVEPTRPYIRVRDEKILPLRGLRDKNPAVTAEVNMEIVRIIADKLGYSLESESLSNDEKNRLAELRLMQFQPDWIAYGRRDDVKENQQVGETEKFEIELILKRKPTSNVFSFDIDTEGLSLYYQPELSEKEKDEGTFRPEDVIGSYAVYYTAQEKLLKTKIEADKFQTGKAFHIYRPLIKDAKGKKEWGILAIDQTRGILSVTASWEFLNNATYPVSIDPTFGYDTIGQSSVSTSNLIMGSQYAMGNADEVGQSITAYVAGYKYDGYYKLAIYDHSSGNIVPNGQTPELTSGQDSQWENYPYVAGPTLSANGNYILAIWIKESGGIHYDSGGVNQGHSFSANYVDLGGTFPSNVSFETHDTNMYSIYVTYATEEGPKVNFSGVNLEGVNINQ